MSWVLVSRVQGKRRVADPTFLILEWDGHFCRSVVLCLKFALYTNLQKSATGAWRDCQLPSYYLHSPAKRSEAVLVYFAVCFWRGGRGSPG